jgi:hypothetical protein
MRRVLLFIVLAFALAFSASPVLAAKPRIQHLTFSSTPFTLDLSDPSGSAQCDVQVVGYDTGVAQIITFFDSSGAFVRQILVQSISSLLTNPENGAVIEVHAADTFQISQVTNPDGSITVVQAVNGLNILYKGGDKIVAFAGRALITVRFFVDKNENVTVVEFVETETPRMLHAFPLLCELLA